MQEIKGKVEWCMYVQYNHIYFLYCCIIVPSPQVFCVYNSLYVFEIQNKCIYLIGIKVLMLIIIIYCINIY